MHLRIGIAVALVGIALGLTPVRQAMAQEAAVFAEQHHASQDAPIAGLRQQEGTCGHEDEGDAPAPAERARGHPAIAHKQPPGDNAASDVFVAMGRGPPCGAAQGSAEAATASRSP